MPMLGNSLYGFDDMPMNLDVSDAMAQPYAPNPTHLPVADGLAASADQPFSPADTVTASTPTTNLAGTGPLTMAAMNSTAGPSPAPGSSGNTLTEFTKRRNWPARVVEELRDLLQILDAMGKIRHVSPSVESLTGYKSGEIVNQFIQQYIHPDDIGVFNAEFNDAIATGMTFRLFYRFKKKDGKFAVFETVGHAHIAAAKFAPNPQNQSPFCQAVFMMSRPYPTKNSALLDSFLDHKVENERLKRRIAELKREEAEEAEETQRSWRQSQEGRSDMTPSEGTARAPTSPFYKTPTGPETIPAERSAALNVALTRENLEGIAGSRPDSIREKMARYEGNTQAETIEMLTGLRYADGERSRGIAAGNASPVLIKGDAGIAIPADRNPQAVEKKKKVKMAEEYVCTDCGTLDSPEWRKGPSGPKTLCNACGLRWAKKEKKKNANATNGTNGNGAQTPMESGN
ncbi:blue light receptor, variant 2 [Echria macrotheca]|uniref:Blue light receptor, variant 2 n=1 Tax=Echria macrotheca TaxID=438768 RepID=A0AAJ0B6E1_9PEZI|nr:blue light receptor, variant 2 [Echria macrotheca]